MMITWINKLPLDCWKANIVFSNNGRIKGVEINQNDVSLIKTFLGFKHSSSLITHSFFILSFVSVIWQDVTFRIKFVRKQNFVSKRSWLSQRDFPKTSSYLTELQSEREKLQFQTDFQNQRVVIYSLSEFIDGLDFVGEEMVYDILQLVAIEFNQRLWEFEQIQNESSSKCLFQVESKRPIIFFFLFIFGQPTEKLNIQTQKLRSFEVEFQDWWKYFVSYNQIRVRIEQIILKISHHLVLCIKMLQKVTTSLRFLAINHLLFCSSKSENKIILSWKCICIQIKLIIHTEINLLNFCFVWRSS